jgi:hypothetical protein
MVNNKEKDPKDDKIKEKQEKDRKSAEKAEKAAKTVKLLEGSEELHYPTFTSTSSRPDGDLAKGGGQESPDEIRTPTLPKERYAGVPRDSSEDRYWGARGGLQFGYDDRDRYMSPPRGGEYQPYAYPAFVPSPGGGGGRVLLRDPAPRSLTMALSSWVLLAEGGGRKMRLLLCLRLRPRRRWNKWRRRVAPLTR